MSDVTDLKAEVLLLRKENKELRADQAHWELGNCPSCPNIADLQEALEQNAKLRELLERIQPTDSEGNELDIADTVHMLRSEYDGDHEWDDVIVELTLTKWGGDRWIVRGSKGEAWACDCTKTGYDEDAFEDSDDVEPFDDATLAEAENTKLRKLIRKVWKWSKNGCHECQMEMACKVQFVYDGDCGMALEIERDMRELGVTA